MKKTFFFIAALLVFTHECFSADIELSNRLESSYKAAFYPGVIRYAEEILKGSLSAFSAVKTAVYEGEALFNLGRIDEAKEILTRYDLKSSDSESSYVKSAKNFWLARCYFSEKNFPLAQKYFFESARLCSPVKLNGGRKDYYSMSILWGARTYLNLKDDEAGEEKAIPLLEYVVSNGEKFSKQDFEECIVNLAVCYNDCLLFEKTDLLAIQFEDSLKEQKSSLNTSKKNKTYSVKSDFEKTVFSLKLLRADCQAGLKDYALSYELYCDVMENAPPFLAAQAMKKAYELSSSHKNEFKKDAGEILSRVEGRLTDYPELLSEFWLRLAADAYGEGKLDKSLDYFSEAEKTAASTELKIAAFYRALILYEKSRKTAADCDKSIEILLKAVSNHQKEKTLEEIDENIAVLIARFYGYKKDWAECKTWAEKALDSKKDDVLKDAWYWSSLALYEEGFYEESAFSIEEYEEKHAPKRKLSPLTDSQMLLLRAKSLAKSGKYSDAQDVFLELEKNGKLDNDGYLDFTRTLLKSGLYDLTKEVSSLAHGDESLYLSALASFNQKRWLDSERLFEKVAFSKNLSREHSAFALFYLSYCQYQLEEYESSLKNMTLFVEQNPAHQLEWVAYMTCAKDASFIKKYDSAQKYVRHAIKASKNEDEEHKALILAVGIYCDGENLDGALELLAPYLEGKGEFAVECTFRTAEIYARKNDFEKADHYFEKVGDFSSKKDSPYAEDAFFRRGELKFMSKNYADARKLFEAYVKKWPDGKYAASSVYFSAGCLNNLGLKDRAVLRYLQLAESEDENPYRYASQKNLIDLYEEIGDLNSAQKMAQKNLEEYRELAVSDGINEKIAGLSLKLKKKDVDNLPEIFMSEEDAVDAETAISLASSYRNAGENKKAADMYLKAALFAREKNDSNLAQRSLYGAAEAFDAAGLYGDAKAVVDEMKKLYPKGSYTKKAKKLVQ